jgi:hypothetical protein
MRYIAVLLLTLALAVPAFAQAPESAPPLSWERFGWMVEGGAQAYDAGEAEAIGTTAGAFTGLGFVWSSGPKLALGIMHQADWTNSAYRASMAARWMVTDFRNGGRMRLALGVNGVYYHGLGFEWLTGKDASFNDSISWNTGVYGSMHLTGILYFKLNADYDLRNSFPTVRMALALTDMFAH